MKHVIPTIFLSILITFLASFSWAQDVQFSQYYSSPVLVNPSFAGITDKVNISLNQRMQISGVNYSTSGVTLDMPLYKTGGGVGVQFLSDNQAKGALTTLDLALVYAQPIRINNKWTVSLGGRFAYYQKSLDLTKLTFGDELDARLGKISQSQERISSTQLSNFDGGVGGLLFSDDFFVGLNINHILQPEESFTSGAANQLHRKATLHAGYDISLRPYHRTSTTIAPQIIIERQGDLNSLNLGGYLNHGQFIVGVWYRSSQTAIIMVGLHRDTWRLGYSYDATFGASKAANQAHELSLQFTFKAPEPKKKIKKAGLKPKCPNFHKHIM